MDRGFCTACGAQVPDGASFCGACGTAVQAAAPAKAAAAAPPPVTPAAAAIPARPADAPPAMATPVYAPPPTPAANPPWGRILSVLLGVGLLIFAGIKMYNAFFGAPVISDSAVRQMEEQIRHDFQARGLQVSQVRMTAENANRMGGTVTVGNATIPGQSALYNCSATRQSGSYFAYQCAPESGTAGTATSMTPTMPTPLSTTPLGAPAPSAGTGLSAVTPAQRADMLAECSTEHPAALCECAVDRIATGMRSRQAVTVCAAQLGLPVSGN